MLVAGKQAARKRRVRSRECVTREGGTACREASAVQWLGKARMQSCGGKNDIECPSAQPSRVVGWVVRSSIQMQSSGWACRGCLIIPSFSKKTHPLPIERRGWVFLLSSSGLVGSIACAIAQSYQRSLYRRAFGREDNSRQPESRVLFRTPSLRRGSRGTAG